ncbi:uncharacterized protein LOC134771431 [Penaeus indicus]|uniref:uncharacterized protein LOC134771431 n=1 Tax=Penaeus indicus TaxID=29960 RepID=UPI00300CFBD3
MASHFSWFLFSLLALLFCHDAALSAKTPEELDIQTLEKMKEKVKEKVKDNNQFGVLYLPGKNLEGQECHKLRFNNPRGVNGHCNFAPVFRLPNPLKGNKETVTHSEWQLIHTALTPMLEKWKEGNARMKRMYRTKRGKNNKNKRQRKKAKGNNINSGNTKKGNEAGKSKGGTQKGGQTDSSNCPEALYLYSRLAPDYDSKRRRSGFTCTQAIVNTIPEILRNVTCETTRIVVGFSVVKPAFMKVACEGYDLMKTNGIREYHLDSDLPNKEFNCKDASGPTQAKGSSSKPGKNVNKKGKSKAVGPGR